MPDIGPGARRDARADFGSALYLGLRHGAGGRAAWDALTLGKPAALEEPPGAAALAAALAALQGCEAATLLPSTLHLYRDLFGVLARGALPGPPALLVDDAAYPVARWGVEWAALHGTPVARFGHGDVPRLARLARRWRQAGHTPVALVDGYTPGDAWPPPLRACAEVLARWHGWLVLDDTQALGVLGPDGGGSVRLHALQGMPVLAGASLAKGFGAPLAVLAGPSETIAAFERGSETRVHCSPPSGAAIAAAHCALAINARDGPQLRRKLLARIRQLRRALAGAGLACHGGAFPVQLMPLPAMAPGEAAELAGQVRGVLVRSGRRLALALLLRADHREQDVARVASLLARRLATGGGSNHVDAFRDFAVFQALA